MSNYYSEEEMMDLIVQRIQNDRHASERVIMGLRYGTWQAVADVVQMIASALFGQFLGAIAGGIIRLVTDWIFDNW